MLKHSIEKLICRSDLSIEEAENAFEEIVQGKNPCQTAAFLALLRSKGETAKELTGLVRTLRKHDTQVSVNLPLIDIVGTGGDNANTINISTGASILAAACGVYVAKHGNRAASSQCGSADVLESLGINLHMSVEDIKRCLKEVGIAFFFAPHFHPSMKEIAPVRKALKIRTTMNLLGPLLNPANVDFLLLGVADEKLIDVIAQTLQRLPIKKALVVHCKGLDELAPIGRAKIALVTKDEVKTSILDPLDYDMPRCTIKDLKGGDMKHNASTLIEILQNGKGPMANTLILNAGVAVTLYGKAASYKEGIEKASEVLKSGAAYKKLMEWIQFSKLTK